MLAGFFPVSAQQGTAEFPRLEADPRGYEYAAEFREKGNDWQIMADTSLWASGWTGAGGDFSVPAAIRAAAEELRSSPTLPRDARARGEFILGFMHKRFLKTYSERQTRLDILVETGRYNCVSSAVLYVILAEAAGLDTRGVITKDHAFVAVDTGDELIDVETTNEYGFDPGTRREFQDRFGRTTGFAYVPPRNYRERGDLTVLELISLIFTNRIAGLESQRQYAEAVGLALDRAALLSGSGSPAEPPFFTDPRKDVLDRVFNYGASLIQSGKEREALEWAAAARYRFTDESRWEDFTFTALNNILVKIIRAGDTAGARSLLEANAGQVNSANYRTLEGMVLDAELTAMASDAGRDGNSGPVLAAIDAAEVRSAIPAARASELRTFVILKDGERIAAAEGWAGAAAYLETMIGQYGSNPRLSNALRIFRDNRAADLHNAFAELYNRRDYEAARDAARRALEEFPGHRQLTQDLNMAEQALRNQR
ncbi:hypothetical protein JFL75_01705 [Breznakiella homolactica]|uniref:Protein SirB1 N-terminal domain-containing protein n=2 Tax=Breznakiella homolactica TaxID=2798577 RepID=A0A7T7XRV5_9SPIR|nr:hypothetical protein JFL75_01705 [Breznakiella homolactica]